MTFELFATNARNGGSPSSTFMITPTRIYPPRGRAETKTKQNRLAERTVKGLTNGLTYCGLAASFIRV
jgi:hypothetical protein